jgi:hypothetical protein
MRSTITVLVSSQPLDSQRLPLRWVSPNPKANLIADHELFIALRDWCIWDRAICGHPHRYGLLHRSIWPEIDDNLWGICHGGVHVDHWSSDQGVSTGSWSRYLAWRVSCDRSDLRLGCGILLLSRSTYEQFHDTTLTIRFSVRWDSLDLLFGDLPTWHPDILHGTLYFHALGI